MKTQYKTTLAYLLMIAGISFYCSQGWAFDNSDIRKYERESSFTCPEQGAAGDTLVEVKVRYHRVTGKPSVVEAFVIDPDGKERQLRSRNVKSPHYFGKEKNPANPNKPKLYAFPAVDTGPPPGATICTKNNYPVFVYGKEAWFFSE